MKIVIAGGSGHVGAILRRGLAADGHALTVLSRAARPLPPAQVVLWDGESLGPWVEALDGADVVINLAGRSVDCRYTSKNLAAMLESRLRSTSVIGEAIAHVKRPPKVWLQMSTATIYAHRFDAPNDEVTGRLGGGEPGAPALWDASIAIARAWEEAVERAETPHTRKVVLRSAMVMSRDRGSVFDVLYKLVRRGLGGTIGHGRQYVSWIHEYDFLAAINRIITQPGIDGAINLCAPDPLPNRDFMAALRRAAGRRFGLPAPRWLLEIGCCVLRTESELVLKSRRVVSTRLDAMGFAFRYASWPDAAEDLVRLRRSGG